jgi:hypothetical protein
MMYSERRPDRLLRKARGEERAPPEGAPASIAVAKYLSV